MRAGRDERAAHSALGARMNRLIGDLVDVASIEAGRLAVTREVGDPAHVVTEAVDTFQAQAAASGISLVAEIVPSPSLAAFDPRGFFRCSPIFSSNAIKFTPARMGKWSSTSNGSAMRFASPSATPASALPTDQLEAVFERFLQVAANDRRGVGLGLYISKCIVQGHGGRIWAESSSGAREHVLLHASDPCRRLAREGADDATPQISRRRPQ